MRAPTGSVVGLCSASATLCAMGMAFLGYWGVHEPVPWRAVDVVVIVLAFIGFALLASVPWMVTTPVAEDGAERIQPARRAFACGVAVIWVAAVLAIVG
ncbi:hypothetical protein [Dyella japonica]|uniref:Uncharacterized protein n=1 Tax=Dyella japonica A8 TaxID=1217721 RepID=A0A075JWQ3_9GAMM|nr:hypothetical protein [Dyella japonica]AIF45907.1 hypothetical protein HY57_00820 [Dyella japonica A8]